MKGEPERRARRRAISVLPTPVGPIIRMFVGLTSLRSSSGSCMRRQRLRRAMATARLAACWPTMCLSSSAAISRGLSFCMVIPGVVRTGTASAVEFLDGELVVGVDADVGGDVQALLDDAARIQVGVVEQRARRGLRVAAAGADGHQAVLGLDDVAVAGDDQRTLAVGDQQQGLKA